MSKKLTLLFVLINFGCLAQTATEDASPDVVGAKEAKAEMAFTDAMKSFLTDNSQKAVSEFKKILETFGENAGVYFMLSKAEDNSNLNENAILSAKKSVELENQNFYYLENYSNILIKNQRYKEVVAVLKKQIKLKPDLPQSYFKLADVLMIEGKESDVLKIFTEMEEIFGVNEEITQKKQVVLLKQNKVDAALKEGEKLVKTDPEYIKNQVQILISNNRRPEAITILENAITANPNFFEAYGSLSELYLTQRETQKCKQTLENIIKLTSLPFSVKMVVFNNYYKLLKSDLNQNALDELMVFIDKIILLHPTEARPYVFLADLYIKNNKNKEARDAYLQAVSLDKSIYEAWLALIELDTKLNLIDDLAKHTETATEYYPTEPFFWYHNGFANKLKKNYETAVTSFEEALSLSVQNNELENHINAQLGDVYNELKLFGKSEKAYEMVLVANPNHEQTLNNYSYFLANRKTNLEKAASMAQKLVDLFPKDPAYLETQAWVSYKSGNYKKADEIIDKAILLNPNPNALMLEHKGDILFKLAQKDNALIFWKKALILNPDNKSLETKIKEGNLVE